MQCGTTWCDATATVTWNRTCVDQFWFSVRIPTLSPVVITFDSNAAQGGARGLESRASHILTLGFSHSSNRRRFFFDNLGSIPGVSWKGENLGCRIYQRLFGAVAAHGPHGRLGEANSFFKMLDNISYFMFVHGLAMDRSQIYFRYIAKYKYILFACCV